MNNPYDAPQADLTPAFRPTLRDYGGIGRLAYVLCIVGLTVLQALVTAATTGGPGESLVLPVMLLFAFITLIPVYYRLKNVGMNPWWCLLALIPLANLIIGARCLIFPEGYQDTRQLDTPGKVMVWLFGICLIMLLIFLAMSFFG